MISKSPTMELYHKGEVSNLKSKPSLGSEEEGKRVSTIIKSIEIEFFNDGRV